MSGMDFEEFWRRLSVELMSPRTFKTLVQSKAFEAEISDRYMLVTVTPESSDIPRDVDVDDFRQMWDMMKDDIRSERYVNRKRRYYDYRSVSYICALIDHVVADQDME